jgi:hypothetical protein
MKKIFFLAIIMMITLPGQSQTNNFKSVLQQQSGTATMKSSGRLFAMKDDLTSVIMIVPVDSTVTVLGSDSTYLHVVFQNNEGYILKKQAVMDKQPAKKTVQQQTAQPQNSGVQDQGQSRFSYLENKYGSSMAARLNSGKIWKGMNAGMVNDSWGGPQKINRVIDGNTIKEEWIYNNTWLYFENSNLVDWGPVKK